MQASDSVDDFINEEIEAFVKQPWYVPSTKDPPPLPPLLESAFATIYHGIMDPTKWTTFKLNLPANLLSALKLSKSLQSSNVEIFIQDKSSRICFPDLQKSNDKVESVLSDETKYQKIGPHDPAQQFQPKISSWYSKHKSSLK